MLRMVASDDPQSLKFWTSPSRLKKVTSSLMDMWAFQDLANVDVIPFNEFDKPGTHFCNISHECIIYHIVSISGKDAKE
jgi:hypothetical protein